MPKYSNSQLSSILRNKAMQTGPSGLGNSNKESFMSSLGNRLAGIGGRSTAGPIAKPNANRGDNDSWYSNIKSWFRPIKPGTYGGLGSGAPGRTLKSQMDQTEGY